MSEAGSNGDIEDYPEFDPAALDRSVISIPLLKYAGGLAGGGGDPVGVVIDVNLDYRDGRDGAITRVRELVVQAVAAVEGADPNQGIISQAREQYIVARLQRSVIRKLIELDGGRRGETHDSAIFHVWPDFDLRPLLDQSVSTVKADAARVSFAARGRGIVWAVLDSGIEEDHPHFRMHRNLEVEAPLRHVDFTGSDNPLKDGHGHGTHVGGIIAGQMDGDAGRPVTAARRERDENDEVFWRPIEIRSITGVAPECTLVSYKVLDDHGQGQSSSILRAIDEIQRINNYGRTLRIHGVNLSVGYPFNPEWFACGQSPLCVEVDRLVRTGVVVVAAAGNTGYAYARDAEKSIPVAAGRALTINDPGNADGAITVGSTHRDMPHAYGVSFFSSKGPTGDGRRKPDLVAPGERIVSAAAGEFRARALTAASNIDYVENSGTSMAAPHVSGVIAAFLSVRREFRGHPDKIKSIFTATATDLGRAPDFQGHGLVDLMRAIQSV